MDILVHLLIYNLAASILIYGSLAYNPRIWLHRMPPEVRAKVPEKTPEERKVFIGVALPFLLLLFIYPAVYIAREGTTFLISTGMLLAFFVSFALWDTLILDLLIFCRITPRFVILNGTSRGDYSNMKYHLLSGAKGLAMSVVFSGLLAIVLTFLKNILS
jgi:hypothetical protein